MHIQGTGIGLRHPHLESFITHTPEVNWLEIHSENFFTHSKESYMLEQIREKYPLSMHGIGLSLGSVDKLNTQHLKRLQSAIQRYKPEFISEHLSWSSVDNTYGNDLLPLPYTEECFTLFCAKITQVQDILGRQILIENPSSYLQYTHSTIPEWEFYNALPRETGCGLLLDVNNVYVTGKNHNYDIYEYINNLDTTHIHEIHLAGHAKKEYENHYIYLDDHGSKVSEEVWQLYAHAVKTLGEKPTLIEWDSNIPTLDTLLHEAKKADAIVLELV